MAAAVSNYAIDIQSLEKSYGDWPVLWDLDMSVEWGKFLTLFGTNGAGKTTLLNLLSTQARSDAGTIRVAGYDSRRNPEAVCRQVGVVGHQSFLYDDLTCQENLLFYARLFGLKNIQDRISSVLSTVGLPCRAHNRVRILSHGMQKRLSIARAILHQPGLLLLDEPEAGLDQDSVAMLHALLKEWTAGGGTVVMTTHNLELGIDWADEVAVLSDGSISVHESTGARAVSNIRRLLASQASQARRDSAGSGEPPEAGR